MHTLSPKAFLFSFLLHNLGFNYDNICESFSISTLLSSDNPSPKAITTLMNTTFRRQFSTYSKSISNSSLRYSNKSILSTSSLPSLYRPFSSLEYKIVTSISNSLNVLSSFLGPDHIKSQYDIECEYITHLNSLIGFKPMRHSNKLYFLSRDILLDRIERKKFPQTNVSYDWVGNESYLLS